MTLPPVLVVGSSFCFGRRGCCPSLFIYIDILLYLIELVKRFSLCFQGFLGFFSLRVFWPDPVPGAGDIGTAAQAG